MPSQINVCYVNMSASLEGTRKALVSLPNFYMYSTKRVATRKRKRFPFTIL